VKNFIKAFTTFLVVMRLRGKASGYLVATSIIVNRNLLPRLVFGRGPTQSITTLLKGSLNTGIGCKGYGLMPAPGLPFT